MSIKTTNASELPQAGTASPASPARDPIHDLIDKLQRSQSMVASVDPALGASIRAVAAQGEMPGRADDPMFRTKVAYALQDVEKLAGPSVRIRMPDGLRTEMAALAATSPGLQNERMQALLQGTATMDDRSLVRLIRRDAALIARAFDQASGHLQSKVEGLENQARSGRRAEPIAAAPALPVTPAVPVAAATTPRQADAQAPATAVPAAAPETVVERQAAQQPTAEQLQRMRNTNPTFAIMAALRKPELASPAPWDQQLTPLKGRIACYTEAAQANEEEAGLRAAEQSGQAAVQALRAFAHGPGAGIVGKIQAAGKADPDGLAGVVSGMREGGPYAGLRRTFNADLVREKGLAGALDRASAAVGQYGADRTRADGIAEARGDTAAIAARFAKLDAEIGKAASEAPGRKDGKSQMEELGERAAELASKAIEAVKAAFGRTPSAGAGPTPGASSS